MELIHPLCLCRRPYACYIHRVCRMACVCELVNLTGRLYVLFRLRDRSNKLRKFTREAGITKVAAFGVRDCFLGVTRCVALASLSRALMATL